MAFIFYLVFYTLLLNFYDVKGLLSLLGILKETQTLCSNEMHRLEREIANPQLQ